MILIKNTRHEFNVRSFLSYTHICSSIKAEKIAAAVILFTQHLEMYTLCQVWS